ncbi:MAG: hypothetical protein R2883_05420 [Caldisericia bacterium]
MNRSETLGGLTWFWGTITLFAVWPLETVVFTYLPDSLLRHITGAAILALMLILTNFLQTGMLTWSTLLAPACIFWPIGYIIYSTMLKRTRSALLSSVVGWLGVSILAVIAEYIFTKRLTWSLPAAVLLAFWPAASIAFPSDEDEINNPITSTEEPEPEAEIESNSENQEQ